MLFDALKKKTGIVDVKIDGKRGVVERKHTWVIVIIIAAIVILAFGNFDDNEQENNVIQQPISNVTDDKYIAETEENLKRIISTIRGAGKVNVMVVFETKGEKVPAVNKLNQKESESQEDRTVEKISDEESIILFGSGTEERPYVIEEKMPVPKGVFISASGASDENVKLEIYEAVKALYGISGHRIKVSAAEPES